MSNWDELNSLYLLEIKFKQPIEVYWKESPNRSRPKMAYIHEECYDSHPDNIYVQTCMDLDYRIVIHRNLYKI